MKTTAKNGLVLILLFPYIVAFTPNPSDTSLTELGFAVGHGSYAEVTRDCSGGVRSVKDVSFSEYGVAVTHRTPSDFKFGAAVGATSGSRGGPLLNQYASYGGTQLLWYLTPSVGLDTKYFGLDAGYLIFLNGSQTIHTPYGELNIPRESAGLPMGALRLGNRERTFLSLGFARNLPLLSGGGLVDVGLSLRLGSARSRLWLGLGAYPYDALASSVKGEFPLSERFLLNVRTQLGVRESFEYGLALGGKIIF